MSRIVILGPDFVQNDRLIDLIFLSADDQLTQKCQIYSNIYKYELKFDSKNINVYNINYSGISERKFMDVFNKFLDQEVQNRVDNFIFFDILDRFLAPIDINIFKLCVNQRLQ